MTVFSVSRKKKEAAGRPAKGLRQAGAPRSTAPTEAERDLLLAVLDAVSRTRTVNEYLEHLVRRLQDYSHCGSIGIRLLDDEGNIPYACYTGFSQEFFRSEGRLSVHRDQCFCINVVTRETPSGLPCYTQGGSFLSNGLSKLLDSVPEEKIGRSRRMCKRFGYESVALVPVRHQDRTLGLIHLAYEAENRIPTETAQLLERVGLYAGDALHLFLTEEALRQSEARYRMLAESRPDGVLSLDAGRKELEELRDEFLDIASHEMRSPLTVIIGAVNTALAEQTRLDPEETRQLLQDAASEAETLSSLLSNFIEISRAQTGRLALEPEPVNIKKVARETVDKIARQYTGHRIVLDFPKRLPKVLADQPKVERILSNLLENATRHSPAGSEIRVFAQPRKEHLTIGVSDQRAGTTQAREDLVAALQYPEDSRSIKGAGMGLLVCRRLVEAHGGSIWVDSEAVQGCTLLFTLPWGRS
ncbi:MAG: ATP-binding protein [Dehalococcoidia bacterium]|nr:ATP-binding protein [Dehalococcoidia bacterium]